MQQSRMLIAGCKSGSGKTTITCGLLKLLSENGRYVASLKCGPDYIDPMFHREVIGVEAGNIDAFFSSKEAMRQQVADISERHELLLMEGVMGYYDGLGFTSEASSYEIAKATGTPVVLILPCKGMGASIEALLRGFLSMKTDSGIVGVIFNELPVSLYKEAAKMARSLSVIPLGYLRTIPDIRIESRHLGLVTATELDTLQEKLHLLAQEMRQTIDLEKLLEIASKAEEIKPTKNQDLEKSNRLPCHIAVAKDEAFCFYYEENLSILRELGATLHFFSPMRDTALPKDIDGLILPGGYPELHAKTLEANESMRNAIQKAVLFNIPTIAECGGFLYLHRALTTPEGKRYQMAGALPIEAEYTGKLKRFGYITLTAKKDHVLGKQGMQIPAHEFHYYDSTKNGKAFYAKKKGKDIGWDCVHASNTLYAGYPHISFMTDPQIPLHFLSACMLYQRRRNKDDTME